jgi:glucokinase
MTYPKNTYALVADIGGTNTRVAMADGRKIVDGTIRRYRNAAFPGLESVLRRYVEDEGEVDPIAACVAVAGPVRDGRATMTNLDWTIDKDTLARATGAKTTAILNDLQAQGHALGHIDPTNIRTVFAGPEGHANAAKLVVGVGTGFNAAPVFDLEHGRVVTPSESGHANLPIRNEMELRLCQFVSTAFQLSKTSCPAEDLNVFMHSWGTKPTIRVNVRPKTLWHPAPTAAIHVRLPRPICSHEFWARFAATCR